MINRGQTYQEYCATMAAYKFYPLRYETWFDWMIYHGVVTIVSGKDTP